ncbi:dethiobiotin synthase [Candidatus Njordibacter sp. Uisw_039]|jgi:dethiobiotin synthetase|uniref:dethiobiotin synthase n=2 Tax=Candidatus Njordibacter sp. Uisw_039 TaxID=3230972 RepID=UPI003A482157|tara:strand:- start:43 stop:750 length:708 start_codon:yes stop_codon:yes gene_type:complete
MRQMKKRYFIAGTDTDAGKTMVACALLAKARGQGLTTAAVKPVAAGCIDTKDGLRNDDAEQLLAQCTLPLYYEQVNPVAFMAPIAPHIAAQQQGQRMQVGRLAGFTSGVLMQGANLTLVEGAGGWRVPVNERETLADLAIALSIPVVLVVGMRLGCINHTLLTVEAITRDGLELAGWVANCIDPQMDELDANVTTLQHRIQAPMLGLVPNFSEINVASQRVEACQAYLDLETLLK